MNFSESNLLYKKLKLFFPHLKGTEEDLCKGYIKVITFYSEAFCKKLKKTRLEKGFSQKDLIKRLSITPASYSAWENGNHVPKAEYIKAICEILEIDPSELISFDENNDFSSSSRKIPIIDCTFFHDKKLKDMVSLVNNFSENEYLSNRFEYVAIENDADFLFDLVSDDMKSNLGGIPAYSLISCSFAKSNDLSDPSFLKIVNGKIVVVSVCNGPGLIRQVLCDGQYLILRAWNEKVQDKRVSIIENKAEDNLTMNDIVIFAFANREIRDLENIVH